VPGRHEYILPYGDSEESKATMSRILCRFGVPIVFVVVLALPVRAVPAQALWAPLPLGGFDELPWGGGLQWPGKFNGSKDIIPDLTVAHMRIVLEQTSFQSVQKHFGGVPGGQGDAGTSHGWLCLYQLKASKPWVIWLESDELDGGKVSGFQWRAVPLSSIFDNRCHSLPKGSTVDLPAPIRLGQSQVQIVATLGAPSAERPDVLFYEHKRSGHPGSTINDVAVQLSQKIVEAISVWRASSL